MASILKYLPASVRLGLVYSKYLYDPEDIRMYIRLPPLGVIHPPSLLDWLRPNPLRSGPKEYRKCLRHRLRFLSSKNTQNRIYLLFGFEVVMKALKTRGWVANPTKKLGILGSFAT